MCASLDERTYLHCKVLLSSSLFKVTVRVKPTKKMVGEHTAHRVAGDGIASLPAMNTVVKRATATALKSILKRVMPVSWIASEGDGSLVISYWNRQGQLIYVAGRLY